MGRFTRLAVLAVASMSLLAVLSSSAGAVTWHNTGDTAFTATNTTAGTLSVTGVNLLCSGADATGTSPGGTVAGFTYRAAVGVVAFTGCTLSGIPLTVSCSYAFTTSIAVTAGGVVDGVFDELCSVVEFGSEICKIEGQTPVSYTNPSGSTSGRFLFAHSSTLRTTHGSGGGCPFGAGEPFTLTTQAFTITNATGGATSPHLGPVITRTA